MLTDVFMRLCQVKEEETANSSILAAIKAAEEVVMQDIRNLKVILILKNDPLNVLTISVNRRTQFLEMKTWKICQTDFLHVFFKPSYYLELSKLTKETLPTRAVSRPV